MGLMSKFSRKKSVDWETLPDVPKNNNTYKRLSVLEAEGSVDLDDTEKECLLVEDVALSDDEYRKQELLRKIQNSDADVRTKLAEDAYYYFADEIVKQAVSKFGKLDLSSHLDRESVPDVELNLDDAIELVDTLFKDSGKFSPGLPVGSPVDSMGKILRGMAHKLEDVIRNSTSLREALLKHGLLTADDVDFIFGKNVRMNRYVKELKAEINEACKQQKFLLQERKNVETLKKARQDRLTGIDVLNKTLYSYGRPYEMFVNTSFNVLDWEGNDDTISNDVIVVTALGVFLITVLDISPFRYVHLENDGTISVTAYSSYRVETRKKLDRLVHDVSRKVGHTVEKINAYVGKEIPVIPIILLEGSRSCDIKNDTSIKMTRTTMLYEMLHGFGVPSILTPADREKISQLVGSFDVDEVPVEEEKLYTMVDYKALGDMWEREYAALTRLMIVKNYLVKSLELYLAEYGLD